MSQIVTMAVTRSKRKVQKKTIGSFMAEYRASRGVSQRTFADQIGTTGPYVALIESDKYKFPTAILKRFMMVLTKEEKSELFEILVESLKEECGL